MRSSTVDVTHLCLLFASLAVSPVSSTAVDWRLGDVNISSRKAIHHPPSSFSCLRADRPRRRHLAVKYLGVFSDVSYKRQEHPRFNILDKDLHFTIDKLIPELGELHEFVCRISEIQSTFLVSFSLSVAVSNLKDKAFSRHSRLRGCIARPM